MNYGRIFYCDIANGIGCRTALFVSGCTHHCIECFNPETWDFSYGTPFTEEAGSRIIESVRPEYIDGLTILGGEPMEPANQSVIRPFLVRFREETKGKSIWIYSGYTYEELMDPDNQRCHTEDTEPILSMTDILVDGEFHIAEKDITLAFRGSRNQRIIDVQKSLVSGQVVLSPLM